MANAGGFENNIFSASLIDRRGVSVELGANMSLCEGGTTIAIHERYGLHCAGMCRPELHAVASTYTTTHDGQGMSRSYDIEDNESHEDYGPWLDEGGGSGDDESLANTAVMTVTHVGTETQHEHD